MRVDFAVSLLANALGPHYDAIAAFWIVLAGTLWWYLISRLAEIEINKLRLHRKPASN